MAPASSMVRPNSIRSVNPMVLSTAISPVRSRALIIIAFAVTSRIEHHGQAYGIHQQTHVAPHGGEAGVELLLGAGLGGRAGIAEEIVHRLAHLPRFVRMGDPQHVPPRKALSPGPLVQQVVVEKKKVWGGVVGGGAPRAGPRRG